MPEYQLLPCPFCDYDNASATEVSTVAETWAIRCPDCETVGPEESDEIDAQRAWNKRPAHAEVQQEVTQLREEVSRLRVARKSAEDKAMDAQDALDALAGTDADALLSVACEERNALRAQVEQLRAQLALRITLEDDDE